MSLDMQPNLVVARICHYLPMENIIDFLRVCKGLRQRILTPQYSDYLLHTARSLHHRIYISTPTQAGFYLRWIAPDIKLFLTCRKLDTSTNPIQLPFPFSVQKKINLILGKTYFHVTVDPAQALKAIGEFGVDQWIDVFNRDSKLIHLFSVKKLYPRFADYITYSFYHSSYSANGTEALASALERSDMAVVEALDGLSVDIGAPINIRGIRSPTKPLNYAILRGDLGMVVALLQRRGVSGRVFRYDTPPPLCVACEVKRPNLKIIETLLKRDANPFDSGPWIKEEFEGITIIGVCAKKRRVDILQLLLKHTPKEKVNPFLIEIIENGTPVVLQKLLELNESDSWKEHIQYNRLVDHARYQHRPEMMLVLRDYQKKHLSTGD